MIVDFKQCNYLILKGGGSRTKGTLSMLDNGLEEN